jgi:D-sedoheptulose 7-phosphate isomerase
MKSEPTNLAELVGLRIEESAAVKRALLAERELIAAVGEELIEAYRAGRKLLIFGNGGSASDAQHIAAELVGRYYFDRRALPALALTVNASSLTAIGNDYSFDHVFARQVEAFGHAGDVAVGISTSGNSANVIEGVHAAKRMGLVTVGLTGAGGGRLKGEVDYCVAVPSADTPRIQEAHALIGHVWCEMVERALFGGAPFGDKDARRD